MTDVTADGMRRVPLGTIVDLTAVGCVAAELLVLTGRLWRAVDSPGGAIVAAAMLAAGYVMADLLTGFVHWFCDSFFEETTPLIGASLIASFREHHRDPLLMTQHGVLELTGSSFRGLAPILGALVWFGGSMPIAGNAFALSLASAAVATNLLHRWAHDPAPPVIARALQRAGVALTPERHARHHAPPYAGGYCVTSGLLNPLCDSLGLWDRAKAVLMMMGVPVSRADRG